MEALRDAEEGAADDPRKGFALEQKLEAAAAAPLEIASLGADVAELAALAGEHGEAAYRADAAAAAALAAGGASAAAHLVRVNLGVRSQDPRLVRALASENAAHDVAAPPARVTPVSRFADATDAELVRACRAGDQEAWNELVERYSRYVYAIAARGFRLSEEDAEDVFQDVFTRVYTRLDSLRDDSALRPWIAQLTRRRCLDAIAARREVPAEDVTEEGSTDLERGRGGIRYTRGTRRTVGELPGHPRPLLHARPELQDDRRRARDPFGNDREPHRPLPRPAARDARGKKCERARV